jgi:fluoroacetyl-CoA thioesterase
MKISIGRTSSVTRDVTDALSAHTLGNPGVHVLATPCLAGICDKAASEACGTDVPTRRVRVDIRHLAATPVGDQVVISAEVVSVQETRVICRVTGRDSRHEIVSGTVERVCV